MKLSNDLLGLNRLQSVQGKRLTVGRINRYGYLSRYLTQEQRFAGSSSRSGWESRSVAALIPEDQTQIPVSHVPASGEAVFGSTALCLGEKLATGGEGSIYDLSDGTVAKIYHRGKLTVGRREKLERMTAEPVCCEGVCWPKELLRDAEGNFVGYRMERARGTELQRALFTRPALEAHFPNWKKADMVQLCITILEKICALHGRGIILGDINPLNILVVSPTEVWFVDCDSYQIGGYPCPVGTVRFTAPEIQKRNFADFLRTEGNEAFAVATLLFMLMLPGKSPYAQEGGGDLSEAILAMDFPYPCGDNHSDKTPEGGMAFPVEPSAALPQGVLLRYLPERRRVQHRTDKAHDPAVAYGLPVLPPLAAGGQASGSGIGRDLPHTLEGHGSCGENRVGTPHLRRVRQRLRHHGEREGLLQGEGDVPAPPLSDLPKTAP